MSRMLVITGLILCLACPTVFAGGSGNCVQPLRKTSEWFGVGGAFEYNYTHNRINDLDNKWGPMDMKVRYINDVYGKITAGLFDNFNLYATIGGTHYDLEYIERQEDAKIDVKLENGLLVGTGINGLFPLFDFENFGIGFDTQINFSFNDVRDITRSGVAADMVKGAFYRLDGKNSIYLTYKFDIESIKTQIVPYIGGFHSWMLVGTSTPLDYQVPTLAVTVSEKHVAAGYDLLGFGILLGLDVEITKFVCLNIEGRFIGENALTTGATIKF